MKKRMLFFTLAALLLMTSFSGCSFQMTTFPQATKATTGSPSLESTPMDTTEATQATEATAATQATNPLPENAWSASTVMRARFEKQNEVINGVYVSCGNYDYTNYGNPARIFFYLMCEKPLPSDATITVPTDLEYEIIIGKITPEGFDCDAVMFRWYQYGVDPLEDYQLNWKLWHAREDYNNKRIDKAELDRIKKERQDFNQKYKSPYEQEVMAARQNYAAPFYLYEVEIRIKKIIHFETISDIELAAGDMSCTVTLGHINLTPEKLTKSEGSGASLLGYGEREMHFSDDYQEVGRMISSVKYTSDLPWSTTGRHTTIWFHAADNITLTDIEAYDHTLQATHAELIIKGQNGNVQISWTPGMEIPIRKGESVAVCIYYDSPYMQQAECHMKDMLMIKYTDSNGGGYVAETIDFRRKRDAWETYMWAFKNMDTKPVLEAFVKEQQYLASTPPEDFLPK